MINKLKQNISKLKLVTISSSRSRTSAKEDKGQKICGDDQFCEGEIVKIPKLKGIRPEGWFIWKKYTKDENGQPFSDGNPKFEVIKIETSNRKPEILFRKGMLLSQLQKANPKHQSFTKEDEDLVVKYALSVHTQPVNKINSDGKMVSGIASKITRDPNGEITLLDDNQVELISAKALWRFNTQYQQAVIRARQQG